MYAPEGRELERIRTAYRERDDRPGAQVPSLVLAAHLHELEWQTLRALGAARVVLPDARVLDIGSGTGYLLHRLSELGARDPKGVELVPERVEEARRRYPGLDVSCASATELAFSDASFDVVTQFTCLSSILDVGTRHVIARETLRVLRPGGVVLSYDLRPSPRPLRGPRRLFGGPLDPRTPIAPLGPADLRGLWGEPERLRAVQLNLDVARAVKGRRALVAVLRAMPPLRSHLLATFRKPPR